MRPMAPEVPSPAPGGNMRALRFSTDGNPVRHGRFPIELIFRDKITVIEIDQTLPLDR